MSNLDLGYGNEVEEEEIVENKPRILLMGLRRSGKSSIRSVVFSKLSPAETLFLETTSKIIKNEVANSSFVQFQVWDCPGQVDLLDGSVDVENIFMTTGAVVFVIDAMAVDDYTKALSMFHRVVVKAMEINPKIFFQVFIHKVDGLADDYKIVTKQNIQSTLQELDELAEVKMNAHVTLYLTSIYDHSIFEAFSKTVQLLLPQLPVLEYLLDILNLKCSLSKSFLLDVVSKVYIATDSAPVDTSIYELCSDSLDVAIDLSCIYGLPSAAGGAGPESVQVLPFDDKSRSLIHLSNGNILYMREVNKYLALIAVMNADSLNKKGIIDFNFSQFRKAISDVFTKKATRSQAAETLQKGLPKPNMQ